MYQVDCAEFWLSRACVRACVRTGSQILRFRPMLPTSEDEKLEMARMIEVMVSNILEGSDGGKSSMDRLVPADLPFDNLVTKIMPLLPSGVRQWNWLEADETIRCSQTGLEICQY